MKKQFGNFLKTRITSSVAKAGEKAGNVLGKQLTKGKDINQLSRMMIKMCSHPLVGIGKVVSSLYKDMPSEIREVSKDKGITDPLLLKDEYFAFEDFKKLWIEVCEQTEQDFVDLVTESLNGTRK